MQQTIQDFIIQALAEDIGDGDHSALCCIHKNKRGKARLHIKDNGILAGVKLSTCILLHLDPSFEIHWYKLDGEPVTKGEIGMDVEGSIHNILKAERLLLNCMQRMSGIATLTMHYVIKIKDLPVKIVDTRKTSPNFRFFEKWAVRLGGGHNHRFGLYDMIMLKDNHVDYAGGINNAITLANEYRNLYNPGLKIEIETRNIAEVQQVLDAGNIDRIMLDNYSVSEMKSAIQLIANQYETEASGGITLDTVRAYAETGVDIISIGALTHSYKSMDLSLKASV